jgi:addiction module RelE/StbE family toxin
VGYEVVLSRTAAADLVEIVEYIARDNPAAAARFGHELVAHTRKLEDFPEIGRVVPEFQIKTLRELIHGAYRVVYEIDDAQKRVAVARFWHAARGVPEIQS